MKMVRIIVSFQLKAIRAFSLSSAIVDEFSVLTSLVAVVFKCVVNKSSKSSWRSSPSVFVFDLLECKTSTHFSLIISNHRQNDHCLMNAFSLLYHCLMNAFLMLYQMIVC